jgi:hypothetical protein
MLLNSSKIDQKNCLTLHLIIIIEMLLLFLLIIPIILWLIPLSGFSKGQRILTKSFLTNFATMSISVAFAAIIMWYSGMNSATALVVLLSISTCWGAIFHLINKRRDL